MLENTPEMSENKPEMSENKQDCLKEINDESISQVNEFENQIEVPQIQRTYPYSSNDTKS